MRTEKRDVYICGYCGDEYSSEEACIEHEKRCYSRGAVVRVDLRHTIDDKFVFTVSTLKACQLLDTQEYEEVCDYDENCDYFAIFSGDTSDEHIAELRDKLIKKATELIKENREEYNKYYEGLIKELEQVNKKEDK